MDKENYKQILSKIETLVFDVDGVFTDGSIQINEEGEMLRTMNAKDGYALQLAIKKGFNVIIISGGNSEGVRKRFNYLGVSHIFLGVKDKVQQLEAVFNQNNFDKKKALYMGDDLPDLLVMQEVTLPCCPADAVNEVKKVSKYISSKNGGYGAVRDVIEQILKLQGSWFHE